MIFLLLNFQATYVDENCENIYITVKDALGNSSHLVQI